MLRENSHEACCPKEQDRYRRHDIFVEEIELRLRVAFSQRNQRWK